MLHFVIKRKGKATISLINHLDPNDGFIPADSNGKLERNPWESAMPPKNKFHILTDKNNESLGIFLQLILSAIGRIIKKCICKMTKRYNSRLLPYCSQTYLVRFIFLKKKDYVKNYLKHSQTQHMQSSKNYTRCGKKRNDFFRKICINLKGPKYYLLNLE